MLKRQVDVLADLVALGHRRQRRVVDRRRIEVEQPDPFEAVDLVELAQQSRERAALVAIDAVERRVLRDQQQFLHAAGRQRARFADDRVCRPAAILAAQRRDDAERALVVAAFGDLHVGVVTRRRQQSWRLGVVDVGRQGRGTRGAWCEVRGARCGVRGAGCGVRRAVKYERRDPAGASHLTRVHLFDRSDDFRHLAGAEHRIDLRNLAPSARRDSARPCSR